MKRSSSGPSVRRSSEGSAISYWEIAQSGLDDGDCAEQLEDSHVVQRGAGRNASLSLLEAVTLARLLRGWGGIDAYLERQPCDEEVP